MKSKPKPLPSFASLEDEAKFWLSQDPDEDDGSWEEVLHSPRGRSRRVGGRRPTSESATAEPAEFGELVTIVLDAVLDRLKNEREIRLPSRARRQIVRDVVKATRARQRGGSGRTRSAAR